MKILVSPIVHGLAQTGQLTVITCQLDPGADKALQEGARPEQVTLKPRGSRKKGTTFHVIGIDRVLKGYAQEDSKGRIVARMTRTTARVVIGAVVVDKKAEGLPKLETGHPTPVTSHETPPG